MDQEEKIEELYKKLKAVEGIACKNTQILHAMDVTLRPIVLEFQDSKEGENIVSRMVLDG